MSSSAPLTPVYPDNSGGKSLSMCARIRHVQHPKRSVWSQNGDVKGNRYGGDDTVSVNDASVEVTVPQVLEFSDEPLDEFGIRL